MYLTKKKQDKLLKCINKCRQRNKIKIMANAYQEANKTKLQILPM